MITSKNSDKNIDKNLEKYVLSEPRKSFFLFAGAGSGKTYSLVLLLKKIRDRIGKELLLKGKNVAVITFTNAATDEIVRRLDYSTLFHISTIHSFVWNIIKNYSIDIRELYCNNITEEINKLELKIEGKSETSKGYITNSEKVKKLKNKLENVKKMTEFVYNPNGINLENNALSHNDVIKISSQMIIHHKLLQKIIAQKYPIFLIDESQDTKECLIDAFFEIQKNFADIFTLGLLGDQKQRIYAEGKVNIETFIPKEWEKPIKIMNYRSAKRIINLSNCIGKEIEEHAEQSPREDAEEGIVRFFIVEQSDSLNKQEVELKVQKIMSEKTQDGKWFGKNSAVKTLTLEHMMAAKRLGFGDFWEQLNKVQKYQMSLLQGTVSEIEFFTKLVLPISNSISAGGNGKVALDILQKSSPLLDRTNIHNSYQQYLDCRKASYKVVDIVNGDGSIREVVKEIINSNLLIVPEVVKRASLMNTSDSEKEDKELQAWGKIIDLPISRIASYDDYINHRSRFDTHQGVKGLEFDRVLVIIDDIEAKGHLFSYEKLFGVKELSEVDLQNRKQGKESSLERTQRLFYVTCTRAKKSLAIVMYTKAPLQVKQNAIKKGWFSDEEIELL